MIRPSVLSVTLGKRFTLASQTPMANLVSPLENQNNTPQTVVEGDDTPRPVATTVFHNDAGLVTATTNASLSVPDTLASFNASDQNQTISDFMMKPIIVQQGTISNTDTFSSFAPIYCPYDLLNPMRLSKLDGFMGFKATAVFRIQVNATPFQQGRYMLTACYTGGVEDGGGTAGASYITAHTNTLVQRSQLPRVELDINCDTEGILRVPFVSALNWYPLAAKNTALAYGDWANVRLFPYEKLNAVTNVTATYTIWQHFEDLQLYVATAPQSGRMTRGSRRKPPASVEQDSQRIGPIESVLLRVKGVAAKFGQHPLLSAYATPLTWGLDVAAGAANVFGWSKPINMDASKKVLRRVHGDYSVVDTSDDSAVLAMTIRNQVSVFPSFAGTDVDEMDINYIASIPAWKTSYPWSVASTAGTALFELAVQPVANVQTRTASAGVIYSDFSPMEYVSRYFSFWRGSITFTFKIVRTQFHSGRLQFVFFPHNDDIAVTSRNAVLAQYVHREVVDIREQNEIVITIPYCSSRPYRNIYNTGSIQGSSIGTLSCYVVDSLVAPPMVAQSAVIIMEKSAGPDFELSVPVSVNMLPILGAVPQSGFMPDTVRNDCAITSTVIGSGDVPEPTQLFAETCIGEKIVSMRALLQSMNHTFSTTALPSAANRFNVSVYPYIANVATLSAGALTWPQTGDLFSSLSGLYALSRGGVRIKALLDRNNSSAYPPSVTGHILGAYDSSATGFTTWWNYNSVTTNALPASTSTPVTASNALANKLSGPLHVPHAWANNCLEIRVPQYTTTHSRAVADGLGGSGGVRSLSGAYCLDLNAYDNIAQKVIMSRGAAEDTNFGCFVSVMPMLVSSSFTTVPT